MVLNGDDTVASVEDFITGAGGPVDFVPGLDGTIYYSSINTGQIRQIAFSNANRPPVARVSANPMTGVPPFSVHFSGANSSDPDNDQITYRWDFGDGSTVSTAVSPDHVYSSLGTYTATLTVTDSHGAVGTATAGIIVTNTPVINALPHVTQTVQSPVPPNAVGRDVLVTSTITNSGAASPFIIDFEIYNTSGQLAAQKIYNGQTIPTGGHADYAIDWFPGTVGDYTVKVGLFKAGWVGMYEWNDQALLLHIVDRAATESSFAHQGTTLSPASPAVGNADLITSTITNTGGAGSALVDMEVYKDGIKVGQKFFNDQVFAAGQSRDFSYSFTPLAAGTYTVSIGVFKPGWTGIYAWFDQVAAFSTMSADQSVSIYQDALAPGWYNWSWGSTQDFSDTSLVFAGTNAMRVAYDAPWGGLFLHHAGINTSGKRALSFVIAGSGGGGQNLQIYTFDSNGVQSSVKNLSAYVPDGTIIANTWKQVSIPLADIGADNKAISGIIVQSAGAASARVDIDAMQIQ
ncbi:PKD domain-containing protein [Candidatus Kaiserbacteria bacterium]|nr:PKD domain-containing protein [Candidatus Kaiserbacteria bacterium]